MCEYDVYLFDFDGTLCDTRQSLHPVFAAGFASIGREVTPEESSVWMHYNLHQTLKMANVPEKDWNTVIKATIAALDLPESLALIRLFEDTLPVLIQLKHRGKRIGIVSNNTSAHIRLVLDRLGITLPFDCIIGSDLFHNGKPNPEPIEVAAASLGIVPSKKMVYVGDSLQDPECGINAGISGILLDREDTEKGYEGLRISSLHELLQ